VTGPAKPSDRTVKAVTGLFAVVATEAYVCLARTAESLFALLAQASAGASVSATKIELATLSRLVGLQAQQWWALVPESILLEPIGAAARGVELRAPADPVAALEAYRAEVSAVATRLGSLADAAGQRVAAGVLAELRSR
jgi:hypothetical protein